MTNLTRQWAININPGTPDPDSPMHLTDPDDPHAQWTRVVGPWEQVTPPA